MPRRYESWGRYPRTRQRAVRLRWGGDPLPLEGCEGSSVLPFGNGRSYGDSCLNDGGVLLDARGLDRFLHFDPEHGVLRCGAGVLLSEILELIVPRGWFLPVTPGTRFVTLGGAIANDVHGKNHHRAGTIGCHVREFELLRSDGSRERCSPESHADRFRATIGGLGLTGMITWAEIALRRIAGPWIDSEVVRFGDLEGFFALSAESDRDFEHTVAWVDCVARGRSLGRGLFLRGNHSEHAAPCPTGRRRLGVFVDPPFPLVNRVTLRAFNWLYYHRRLRRRSRKRMPYEGFFYPLDSVDRWNRIYGRRGFLQYQCVVRGKEAVREILGRISRSGTGSFLAVLKVFGDRSSPGLLSFPRPGATLALDFPNRGPKTFRLLDSLDEVVREAGGAVYPAKDARMSGESFRAYFPQWQELQPHVDPRFSSSFWRRATGDNA